MLWRLLLVVGLLIWSIAEIYPPTPRNLIDEFDRTAVTRDATFDEILKQARELEKGQPDKAFSSLTQAIGTNNITKYFPSIRVARSEKNLTRGVLYGLQKNAAGRIRLGLDLQGGTSFLLGVDTSSLGTNQSGRSDLRTMALAQASDVLRKRVDVLGVAQPVVQPVGDNQIEIQLPGLSEVDKASARQTITNTAHLEFRLVHPQGAEKIKSGLTVPGYEVLELVKRLPSGQDSVTQYLVKKGAELGLTGKYVKQAQVNASQGTGIPEISMTFDTEGADKFGKITTQHETELLAIVLDGQLYSAPRINGPILTGSAVITGDFTQREAFELANVLKNPLETPVKILQESSVEPSLGRDSIDSGMRASYIGAILVSLFMLVYYLRAGLVANIALAINVVALLGIMCSIESTLTLPGIAGIVLTMGMAVDANVLIFERMREEMAAGKSMRGALDIGYKKAFGTILDSHVTTLISSILLIFMGTGSVKGFGVTLTIGVALSLFTALVATRLIFDWLLQQGWLQSLHMLRFFKPTNLDFLRFSKLAAYGSAALVVVGLSSGFFRGRETLGPDFRGGDRFQFAFTQKVDDQLIRDSGTKLGIDATIQYQRDGAGNETLQITTPFEKGEMLRSELQKSFPQAGFTSGEIHKVGPTPGSQSLVTAVKAVLWSLLGILVYIGMRYEFAFGLGAVVAVFHDTMVTMGLFCLTGREFSASTVAAILTIVGYSINDKVVIFDRIREDLKLGVRGSFKELINRAINQTLSRTIITSGTVFLSSLSLFIFGGPVLNDFAFTMLVGVVVGTYSSIYISSAFVLWWHEGERPKASAHVAAEERKPQAATI